MWNFCPHNWMNSDLYCKHCYLIIYAPLDLSYWEESQTHDPLPAARRPDGVILFSDILTPLAGMNIPFDIGSGNGPVVFDPIRTMDQVNKVTKLDAEGSCGFVGAQRC